MTESNAESASAQPPPAQPDSTQPNAAASSAKLRRRASDRVAAGVASGLADYLNVDPLLIRVIFVGLVLFNGAGFFIYLAAWLFIPIEGSDTSIVEGWIKRGRAGGVAGTIGLVFLALIGTLIVLEVLQSAGGRMGMSPAAGFAVALAVIVGGILLVRRTSGSDETQATAVAAELPAATVRPVRAPRERSSLGLYVVGLLLLIIGTMALVEGTTTVELLPGLYGGVALGIIGLGLIVGAWWGRARWLILIGLLIIPVAIASTFVRVPFDAGWGGQQAVPGSAEELQSEYRLAGGHLTLDLTELPPSTIERQIAAHVGMGRLLVIVPEGARVDVNAAVGAGATDLLGERQEGTNYTDHQLLEGTGGTLVLDLEIGIGQVQVRTASAGD